ncbi:MAG: hypothetical protein CMJ76_16230 [Planctomycetaceae bacterium]|nr:hypothetical protein [Planctomycetaceae bacterium]
MKRRTKRISSYSFFMLLFFLGSIHAQDAPPAAPETDGNGEDIEALARGPVHEAFATQVNNDPEPGMIVQKAPPEVVDEVPPDYKPDGDNVVWIPGYWGFDDERKDYVWISGVWRTPPAGRRWVPGYWNELNDGKYQWVSGFWQETERRRMDYRGAPPESLESGPSASAPGNNYFWTPGVWVYRGQSYRWRPGYWLRYRPDYVYTPSHWIWTPGGHVFVDGYWDYSMAARGVLFAPVIVRSPLVRYRPSVVIDVGRFHMHWFVRPRYGHYYFGDFYDAHYYNSLNIYPHHYFHMRFGYDPFFAYNHVHFRSRFGISYHHHVHHWHNYFNTNHLHRPARTFGMQLSLYNQGGARHFGLSIYAHNLNRYRVQDDVRQRFVRVGTEHRNAATGNSSSYFRLGHERSKMEGRVATGLAKGNTSTATAKTGTWTLPQVQRGTNVTVGSAQRHVRELGSRSQIAKAVPTAAPGTTNRVVSRPSTSIPRTPGASTISPRPGTSGSLPSRVTIGNGVNGNTRLPSRPGTSPTFPSRTPSGTVPSRVNPSSPRPSVPKPNVSPRPSVTPSVPRPRVPTPRPSVAPRSPRPSAPSPRPSVTPSVPRPSAPSPRPSFTPSAPRPSAPSPRPSVTPSAPRPSAPSPRPR